MRRAVLGREEAENETKRLRDEYQGLRKELEEGKVRERKVAQRIESVMVGGFVGILEPALTRRRKSCIAPKKRKRMHKEYTRKKFEEREKKHSSHQAPSLSFRRN